MLGHEAKGCPVTKGNQGRNPYCEELAEFRVTAWGRYAAFYFAEHDLKDVDTVIMWGSGSGFECAVLARWAKLHGYNIRFVCVEKDAGRAEHSRALRGLEKGNWLGGASADASAYVNNNNALPCQLHVIWCILVTIITRILCLVWCFWLILLHVLCFWWCFLVNIITRILATIIIIVFVFGVFWLILCW